MKNFKDYLIPEGSKTISALKHLDAVQHKVVFVVDDRGSLVGSISDGDIRRHILKAKSLDDDISHVQNTDPKYVLENEYSKSACKEMFEGMMRLRMIPITDENKVIKDIVVWDDVKNNDGETCPLKRGNINAPVVVMAGGKGTRLNPFTDILPKPLIPIGEKTVLESILDHFLAAGSTSQHLILNYKAGMIEAYLEEEAKKYNLKYVREKEFFGTAGSLKLLEGSINETFILSNCDIIVRANYDEVLRLHKEKGAKLTILSAIKHYKIPYGVVDFEVGGKVNTIKEKPEYTVTINTGVYVMDESCLDYIPENKKYDMPDLIDTLLEKGETVLTYPVNEKDYADIGQWDEYKKSLQYFESVLTRG